MNSVLSNLPFVPQNEEQAKAQRDRRDAQVQSEKNGKPCRYIPVRLVDLYDPSWRERFGPLKRLMVIRNRIGVGGNKTEISLVIKDGYEFFDWDNQIGQHVAWIYDDPDGYNKQLLGSVFFNNQFELIEPEDRKEIELIAIKKRDEAVPVQEIVEEKPLTDEEIKDLSVQTIDEQIAFLQKQKKAVIAKKEKPEAQKESPAPKVGRPKNRRAEERKSPLLV